MGFLYLGFRVDLQPVVPVTPAYHRLVKLEEGLAPFIVFQPRQIGRIRLPDDAYDALRTINHIAIRLHHRLVEAHHIHWKDGRTVGRAYLVVRIDPANRELDLRSRAFIPL